MSRERLVESQPIPQDHLYTSLALRPKHFEGYLGQEEIVNRLRIALDAARSRQEPIEHLLLHGPPGLGKTTLAHVVAHELEKPLHLSSGPALSRASDLVGLLTRMGEGDVLFIDEIHRLPAPVEEYLYPAMEDFKIDFTLDAGMHARVVTYQLKPFTLIGATTRAGLLSGPMRSRFGIVHHLDFYPASALEQIIAAAAIQLDLPPIQPDALTALASRARGTPRVALRLLRRVRDFAQIKGDGVISLTAVNGAMELEKIDDLGLDQLDRRYLRTMHKVYEGGPVGVEAMSATLGDDVGTLKDVVEPYLLRLGLIARTPQGRKLTPQGITALTLASAEITTPEGHAPPTFNS